MSDDSLMIVSSLSGALALLATVIGIVNHKRIRSNCCGRKAEVSLDIENTSERVPSSVSPSPVNNPVGSHPPVDPVK
jgi:hypothetical protein